MVDVSTCVGDLRCDQEDIHRSSPESNEGTVS